MGWFELFDGHEGYVVGYVREPKSGLVRELGYHPDDDRPVECHVDFFAAACDCGWRSPRFVAPLRATYAPHIVLLEDDQLEEAARELWSKHLREVYPERLHARRPDGVVLFAEPAAPLRRVR